MKTYGLKGIKNSQDRLVDIDFSQYNSFEHWLDERADYYRSQAKEAWENGDKPSQAWRRELVLAEKYFGIQGQSVELARVLLEAENRKYLPAWLRSLADKINGQYLSFPSLAAYRAARNTIADLMED